MRSFREDTRSFRSNIAISSTASSPGYPLKGAFLFTPIQSSSCFQIFISFSHQIVPFVADEIDPSTYSFTTALKGTLHLNQQW